MADEEVLHATHVGVAETFIVLGIVYLCFMMVGAAIVRVPAPGWKPEGYIAAGAGAEADHQERRLRLDALKTPQFWLIWWVLCLNVTAGIGVLGQASAMSQEMFPGKVTPIAAAGFVGLLSLFNMAAGSSGRRLPTMIGRKNTYSASSCSGPCSTHGAARRLDRQRRAASCCASWSSSACMAAGSRPCRPT